MVRGESEIRGQLRGIVDEFLLLFPGLEAYWERGRIGPHMRLLQIHKADPAS